MPKLPNCDSESSSKYLHRCIPDIMNKGLNHDQAVSCCIEIWNDDWKNNIIDLDMIYQCTNCNHGMSYLNWYERKNYSIKMDEFYCPECYQVIIGFDFLKKEK